jgi:sugar lactone lactonase YvrE
MLVAEIPDVPAGVEINDAKGGPDGRLWLATVTRGARGGGALWTYSDVEGLVLRHAGISHGNGMGWGAQARWIVFVDSAEGSVSRAVFDRTTGSIGAVDQTFRLPRESGLPDGLAVDADDCLWLAVWGGHGLLRLSPELNVLGIVPMMERNVTSCAFMGPELATLAVTTAEDDVDPEAPGGDLHLLDVGVRGAAVGARPPRHLDSQRGDQAEAPERA